MLKGIGITRSAAIGRVLLVPDAVAGTGPAAGLPEEEIARLELAIAQSREQINEIAAQAQGPAVDIVQSQLVFLEDPAFNREACARIAEACMSARAVIEETTERLSNEFLAFGDDYLRERAADIRDVGTRIVQNLMGAQMVSLSPLPPDTILVAKDLLPSQTAQMDRAHVIAIVTELGGRTSHTAIMAKAMGIAAVVGCKGITDAAHNGEQVIVDAARGTVILCPEEGDITRYAQQILTQKGDEAALDSIRNCRIAREDGSYILVAANIGDIQEAQLAKENGADGIGLFRTEFLFMGRDAMPDEETQYAAYRAVAEIFGERPVVIRTLDIGGDKMLPYLPMEPEENPFLGVRAIRLCLRNEALFKCQLRAILRAGVHGNLSIMFPMISAMEELQMAKSLLAACKAELAAQGADYDADMRVGMMVELPATAVLADSFAPEVDFFSIGTNDLTQYTLAVDRGNAALADLYDYMHPAVVSLVRQTVQAAHRGGIPCFMCGEMAGDEAAIPLLAELGLDEYSVGPSSIAQTKLTLSKQRGYTV